MSLPLVYKSGDCFINAFINKRNAYKDKDLKMVFGSVAFNGFFEYGGKDWGLKEFEARHTSGSYCWDAHAWLEDKDGNVYDKFFTFYNYSALINTGKVTAIPNNALFEGVSKTKAKALGVEYVPASRKVQRAIFMTAFKHISGVEKLLLSGQLTVAGFNGYVKPAEQMLVKMMV